MNPLEAVVLIFLVGLPFHLLVQSEFARSRDPKYLRAHGIVVQREEILERRSDAIGVFSGRTIYESITFMGMVYHFDRVAHPGSRGRVGPCEMFVEPGLIYRTTSGDLPTGPTRSDFMEPARLWAKMRPRPRVAPIR